MTVILPRNVQVVIGPPGSVGRIWDQSLYIKGKIVRTASSTPSKATISLYNLAPVSVTYIERPNQIMQVRLGSGVPGTVFYGEVHKSGIKTSVKHPNQITEIKAKDGRRVLQQGYFSASYPAGTTRTQIETDVLALNALARGYMAPLPERTYEAAVALSGTVESVLDELYTGEPVSWVIQHGRFVRIHDDQPMPGNAPIISAETGMMGSPERSDKGVKVKWSGVGDVVPGGPFLLKSRLTSGTFKAIKITTQFDTELKWEDEIVGKALK